MTVTFFMDWYVTPCVVTVLAMLWALFWPANDSGIMGGIVRLWMVTVGVIASLAAWAIAGALK